MASRFEQIHELLDLRKAWREERADLIASGASDRAIEQCNQIIHDIATDLHKARFYNNNLAGAPDSVMTNSEANR